MKKKRAQKRVRLTPEKEAKAMLRKALAPQIKIIDSNIARTNSELKKLREALERLPRNNGAGLGEGSTFIR